MKNYLNSLVQKHRKLDTQIENARIGAKCGATKIRDLKKLRLRLKDQIAAMKRQPSRQIS